MRFFKITGFLLTTLLLLFLASVESKAQMFSVDDGRREAGSPLTSSSITAGWERGDFSYQGNAPQGQDRFDFNSGIFNLRFETPGINMYLGLAGGLTGLEDRGYVNVGATLYNRFMLHQSRGLDLYLPLQINTDLKRVMASSSSNRFQQSAFQIGAGLGAATRLTHTVQSLVQLIPNYGFSNSQGAFVGGSVFTVDGKARIYLLNLLSDRAVVLGYNYRYRSYDIDAELFDYNYSGHTFTLGITL